MDLIAQLTALGMTEYEAKVYVALLRDYPTTGYQLAKDAGIPRSMVYEALGRLETRGAVLKARDEKATLYRPIPPDTLLDRYSQEAERRVADLRGALGPLYTSREDGRVWNFSGRKEALSYAVEMIDNAASELMLVLGDADVAVLLPALTAAHQRGVQLGVMLTGEAPFGFGQVVRHPPHETELHGMRETLMVIADERELLIASGYATTAATVTSTPNLVQIARQFIWMELFAQRIFARLGPDLLERLDPADRDVLHG
jgi:HTH-type transcriptional regulator, sugar sensing transcriptional regulator